MSVISLSPDIINHLNIKSSRFANSGGQKDVFIVDIEGIKYAMKHIKIADERFEREVKICEEFKNNNGIPQIVKVEQFKGSTIILEEYIDGSDLSDLMPNYIAQELDVIKLISKLITILEPVWNKQYVHRDIKPQNIRIRGNDEPVVLDFGIARALDEGSLTATGGQPLSWPYASPEQYEGNKKLISYRTDFFSLGILAFNLYSGELPFGNTKEKIEKALLSDKLVIPKTGNDVIDSFCSITITKNPSERARNTEVLKKIFEK